MKTIKYSDDELLKLKEFAEEQWDAMESRLKERVEEEYGRMAMDEWLGFRQEVKDFIGEFDDSSLFDYMVEWGEEGGIDSEDLPHEFEWSNFEMEWGIP